jgi:hypothetical protein
MVSEAKQGQAWLALGWETDLQKRLLKTSSLETREEGGNAVKVQMESLVPEAERIEEVVLIHVWPETKSYF